MDFPIKKPGLGLIAGRFTDGDRANKIPPSIDTAFWANLITDEILAVIYDAGLTPNEDVNTQLRDAINTKLRAVDIKADQAILGLASKLDKTATAAASFILATARTINGVAFDGSKDITIADTIARNAAAAAQTAADGKLPLAGTAAAATKLASPRTINGVSFDGSSNIAINAVDATARIAASEKNAANGVCPLDSNRLVPAINLPSYVDDVLEFNTASEFPVTGEKGKIYIDLSNNSQHRWSGTVYVKLSASPGSTDAIPEGASNLYFTTARSQSAQVQPDWSAASGKGQILNKPALGSSASKDVPAVGGIATAAQVVQGDDPRLSDVRVASRLQTARTINGVAFDGTANISIADQAARDAAAAAQTTANNFNRFTFVF